MLGYDDDATPVQKFGWGCGVWLAVWPAAAFIGTVLIWIVQVLT
jgi:hypothetical protein